MEFQIYHRKDCTQSSWTGGTTTQLALYPADSSYLDRDFLWRLSTATCDLAESTFSKLQDFDRILMSLDGDIVLAHENVRSARLSAFEQDQFDGAYRTKCFGQMTDYNLMVRKGNFGRMEALQLSESNLPLSLPEMQEFELATQAFYCVDGYAALSVDGKLHILNPGDQCVINYDKGESPVLSVMGEGHLIRCEILYNYTKGDFGAIKIKAQRPTMADFRECIFIANTQYRFSKYTNKRLKSLWYDEALQDAIRMINRFYLPDVIFFLGLLGVAAIGANRFEGVQWILAFLIWILLDFSFVSPLLYFLVAPKPVRAHMKDIDKLTPYETRLRNEQLGRNERIEKIIGKYKFSGTAEYDEDGNRLDDLSKKKF